MHQESCHYNCRDGKTLGYSSFTPVLVSLSFTQRHTHMYTQISALHIFSLQHKFLCSLAFIQAHLFPGRQAVYFLCTFNRKYTYVFPMGAYTLLPFPHVQGGIETVCQHHHHHTHPSMSFLFSFPALAEGTLLFLVQPAGQVQRAEGLSSFFLSHPC